MARNKPGGQNATILNIRLNVTPKFKGLYMTNTVPYIPCKKAEKPGVFY